MVSLTSLVGDINLATPGSNPRQFAVFAGCLFFVGELSGQPAQLWRANPGTGVVEMVETAVGAGPFYPEALLVVGSRLFVRAYESATGWSLFQIDAASGSLLTRVAGTVGVDPAGLLALGGQLYYSAYATDAGGNGIGRELVRLESQTGQISTFDVNPGGNWSSPRSLTTLNGRLFFLADGGGTGAELWGFNPVTDTAPQLLRDIWPGGNSSSIANLTASGGKLYFTASDGSTDEELWVSDGTPGGTSRVADINQNTYGSDPQPVVSSGGKLFFTAYTDASGWELHRLDPATGSVQKLEIRTGSNGSEPGGNGGGFADLNGTLYFSAYDDSNSWQLWRVRPDGALQLLPLGPGQSAPQALTVVGNNLYFAATGSTNRGIDLSRSFAIGGEAVTLSFDFLRLDSWDNEQLRLYLDGQLVFSQPFVYYGNSDTRTGSGEGYGWSITPISVVNQFGGSASWQDQIFRVSVTIPAGRASIRLGLGSTLDEALENESYGLRNLEIRSTTNPSQIRLSDPGTDPTPWTGGLSASTPALGSFIGSYGFGSSPSVGRELWSIDTTTGEPVPIDINPGAGSADPWGLINVGGKLVFTAYTPGVGHELWTLDPADNLPHLVADLNPGEGGSRGWWYGNNAVVAAAGRLYYTADGPQGRELYMVSPGIAGAQLIDLNLGAGSSSPELFTVIGDRLFFKAYDGSSWGLYATSVATGVPTRLSIPGLANNANYIDSLFGLGNLLYFRSSYFNDSFSVYQPLYTVEAATGVVSAVSGVSSVGGLVAFNGQAYFKANSAIENAGYELFALAPGDASQTPKLLDLLPGPGTSSINWLAAGSDALYAVAYGRPLEDLSRSFSLGGQAVTLSFDFLRLDSWDGEQLCLYLDGQLVFSQPFVYYGNNDLRTGSTEGYDWSITPISALDQFGGSASWHDQIFRITVSIPAGRASIRLGLGSTLDQSIDDESYGIRNLEIRPVANPGELLLSDSGADPSLWRGGRTASSTALGTFLGVYGVTNEWNLWRLDPTELNRTMRPLLPSSAPNKDSVRNLFTVGGTLYFSYDDGVNGRELWQSDGTAVGTRLAADINGRTLPSSPQLLTDVNGKLYFTADNGSANNGVNGRGLYELNSATSQVQLLVVPGLSGSNTYYIDSLVNANGRLYFRTSYFNDAGTYRPLYTLDPGTGAISQVAGLQYVDSISYLGGQLFFRAYSSTFQEGYELYRIADGSAQPVLIDVNPGGGSSSAQELVMAGGVLYFTAERAGIGRELFRLDASFNAVPVRDIWPGANSANPRSLFAVGTSLFFVADDGFHGAELWQTDGTEAGTRLARDINNLTLDASPDGLLDVNGILYFIATDGALGRGLYRIDPASGAPQRLTVPGLTGGNEAYIDGLVNANGRLFFRSSYYSNASVYRPLYTLDPATGSISQVSGVQYVDNVKYWGGQLYFTAYSSSFQEGYELFHIPDGEVLPRLIDVNSGGGSSSPNQFVINDGTLYFAASTDLVGRELFRLDSNFQPLNIGNLSRFGSNDLRNVVSVGGALYFTEYSAILPAGPGQDVSRSFALNGEATTISFDLQRNDTWDGEVFTVYLDDAPLFGQRFYYYSGTAAVSGVANGISWSLTPTSSWSEQYGANWGYSPSYDQRFRVQLQLPAGRSSVKLGFSSSLDEASSNESYFIDNLEIRGASNALIASDTFDTVGFWSGGVVSTDPVSGSVLGPYAYPASYVDNWRLWKVNPAIQQAEPITSPALSGDAAYYFDNFVGLGNKVFFRYPGWDGSVSYPLYAIDPATGVASQVAGLRDVASVRVAGGALYAAATYADQGGRLVKIDASASITPMDLQGGYDAAWLTAVGNTLYFTAYAYGSTGEWLGRELWKIDPVSGSPRVLDLRPGYNSSSPRDLVDVQGTLYFIAGREDNGVWIGEELYRIDPITDQVELLGDIYSGGGSSNPASLTLSNGRLYFAATDIIHGRELWRVQVSAGGSGIEVSRSLPEDSTLAFAADDFATPYAAGGGGTLQSIRLLSLPLNGQLRLGGVACTINQTIAVGSLGQLRFVPEADYNGSAAFNWTGSNGGSFASQPSLVNLTITPVADAPRLQQPLVSRSIYSNRTDGYTFDLNTFRDPDLGQALSYSATLADGSPLPAWISLNGRSFSFTPPIGNATVDIRVVATDPDGLTSLAAGNQGPPINWIDWTGADLPLGTAAGAFPEHRSITATLAGNAPLYFAQVDGGTNYFNPSGPYTGPGVSAPAGSDMIGLAQAGSRTMTLSQSVSNLYFAYVSLNGNTLTFDRDFEIVSQSDLLGGPGYWGSGTAAKQLVTIGGVTLYQLVAQGGEPHGLLRFTGPLSSLSWTSAVSETWHGFTVGTSDPSLALSAPGSVFTLGVLNASPQSIGLSVASINENSANGTVVGAFTVTDPNTNDRHTLTLLDSAGGRFALSGSAAAGYNLVVANGTLLDYEAATSHQIRVQATDDSSLLLEQSFTISLGNLTDSAAGNLSFSAANFSVREDGQPVVAVTVNRVGGVEGSVSATVLLTPGTATYPADYGLEQLTVLFANGETSRTVAIPIANDALIEGDQTLTLSLTNPTGGAGLTGQLTATLTIIDNDFPAIPTPTVTSQITNDSTPVISGTATVASANQFGVVVNGRTYTLGSSPELVLTGTSWTLAIPSAHALGDGLYNVVAAVQDPNGTSVSDSTTADLRVDTVAPVTTLTSAPSPLYFPLLQGRSEAASLLQITCGGASWSITVPADGFWQLNTSTAPTSGSFAPNRDGANPLSITATDPAGNSSLFSGQLTIRYPYPDLQISSASLSGGSALDTVALTYTGLNAPPSGPVLAGHSAGGNWIDRFFLSPDPVYGNGNDLAIGPVLVAPASGRGLAISGPLSSGSTYANTVNVQLPEYPGSYYLIAVTDADRTLAEGASEANNVFISAAPISVTPIYTASVSSATTNLNAGQSISLSGQLVLGASGVGVAGKPVTVVLVNQTTGQQFERQLTSGTAGSFSLTFTPTVEQAGAYSVAARYSQNPSEDTLANGSFVPEDSFRVQGLAVIPGAPIYASVAEAATFTGNISFRNTGPDPLTTSGLSVSGAPAGWSVNLGSLPTTLAAGATTSVAYSLRAPDATVLFDAFDVVATAAASGQPSLTANQPFAVTILPNRPVLGVAAAQRSVAMLLGQRTLHEVTVTNTGNVATGALNVVLPTGAPWLSLYGPATLTPLLPGTSTNILLALDPPPTLSLATYQVQIGFLDESHPADSLVVPFSFRATSSATGSVDVAVYDDFSNGPGNPTVRNVGVRLFDRLSDTLLQTINDADGRFSFLNLPVGDYAIEVRADGHSSSWQTFHVDPADQEQVDVFLPSEVVRYSWVVVPTTVQDRYLITLEATFQTEVPIPVVTITPSPVDLRSLDLIGQSLVVPLTLTNHGLVAARDLSFQAPVDPNFTFTILDPLAGETIAAESSLVVDLRIERVADVPPSCVGVELGNLFWDYGTFLPNQVAPITVEKVTPLPFLIDADCPLPTLPIGGGFGGGGGGGGGFPSIGEVAMIAPSPVPLPYVTARVKIRINQDMVLSRDAFEGTFVLENLDPSIDLSSIDIDLEIYDENDNLVTDRFAITSPTLSGFGGALDGTGSLAAATSGTAVYTILAKDTAAPIEPTRYSIGGRVAYSRADGSVNFNLAPAAITVLPQPVLALDYFLQRDVFSDDPFTSPLKEASQPYVLGLLAHNRGYGVANDLAITSAQPEIIENELGLKIGFELIGAAVNDNPVLPSLSIDLGDLAAHSTSEAHWLMTSTLQGRFIDYKATFEYINGLGLKDVPGLSQLTAVNLHELTRRVRDHRFGADTRHDYLVNSNPPVVGQDNTGKDLLADTLYLSNDTTEPVTALVPGTPGLAISAIDPAGEASLSVNAASGWTYLRVIEPSAGIRPITAVRRADGSLISADNYWVTDRTFPENGRPTYESSLHILDFNATGGPATYTVAFGAATGNTAPTVVVTIADQKAKETVPFFFIVPSSSFLDIDAGDTLSYSATLASGGVLPSWLTFNPTTRTFAGTPAAADVTTLAVRVTATDRAGLSVSDTFSLLVEPANYAPVIATPIPDVAISTGAPWTYSLPAGTFTDPDPADTLSLTATRADGTPLPAWLTFNPATRTFSGTPADVDAANLSLRVTATDPAGASDSDTFVLTVSDTSGPVISAITLVGTQLQLKFSEPIITTGLTAARFSATVAGVARSVASFAAVAGDATRLNLTLSGTAPTSSQAVSLLYTDPAGNDLTGVVQDASGNDMASITAPGRNVDTFSSAASIATLASSYTNLLLTGTAATGTGNASNNRIRVNQAAVANVLTGGDGIDDMDGGDGSDIYMIATSTDHSAAEINDSGASGSDQLRFASTTAGQTLTVFAGDIGLESVTIGTGTAAAAVITGTTALSINASAALNGLSISGNAGINSLTGTGFVDILTGNGGIDVMNGGNDGDLYLVTSSADHSAAEINDSGASGSDELRFASTTANQILTVFAGDIGLESVTIGTGVAAAAITTGTTALGINAAAAPNALTIRGNAGINALTGTSFVDAMDGGNGADIYLVTSSVQHSAAEINDSGASGSDELRFASTTAGQTLTVFAGDIGLESVTIGTGTAAAAVITGTTALSINASAALNGLSISGNAGINRLTGTGFDDVINGGSGNDTLIGGAGIDVFRFDSSLNALTNVDHITDFSIAQNDGIQLENAVFTALVTTGALAATAFVIGLAATTADQRIVYNSGTGLLNYDPDGNGLLRATQFATLSAGLALTAGSFMVT